MIAVSDLHLSIGPRRVLQGMTWEAADGKITGLLGPNGAGKTTSLRMLTGLLRPGAGSTTVDGLDPQEQAAQARARLGILSDAQGLYPRLTARENIVYHGRLHGLSKRQAMDRIEHLAPLLAMQDILDRRTAGFSQGERMKTALARALLHDPRNLILDEPTNGLDVMTTRALREILRRLKTEQGKCILVATHVMQEVEYLCDDVSIVARGATVATGTVPELIARTGATHFEDAFVRLAFPASEAAISPKDSA